jgi:hypothetical protein
MKAVTFRLQESDIELLKSYAKDNGLTQAEAIRIAIQNLGAATQVERAGDGWAQMVAALTEQLAVKDGQIASLGRALESAQETAKAAQALHAANVQERALESGGQKEGRRWRWPWSSV